MAYYLNLFSPETLEAFNKSRKNISGFRMGSVKKTRNIRPGDKFICYVTKESRFVGVLEVRSRKFIDKKSIFTRGRDPFVVRFKVKPQIWLPLNQAIPIRDPSVWKTLSFTRGHSTKSNKWTGKLRGSANKINDTDGNAIVSFLKKQKKQKKIYPVLLTTTPRTLKNTRDIGNELHDRVERLFLKLGLNIIGSDYNQEGPDLIVADNEVVGNTKILVQCKRSTEIRGNYPGLRKLIREYASWVREKRGALAILVLSGYKTGRIDKELLERSKVIIWNDTFLKSYEDLSSAIGKYAKYQLFSDLGLNYEFGEEVHLDAFEVNQNDRKSSFHVFKAKPEWLLKSASVLRRADWGSGVKGYQRVLEKSRLKKLKDFFKREDWSLPNTLIFSANSGIGKVQQRFANNKLRLPSTFGSLWIMDGQHRLYSFSKESKEAREKNELVCILFDPQAMGENSDERQANIFVDINMNTKKVNTALLLELLQEFNLGGMERGVKKVALDVVTRLSEMNIFKNLISGYSTKGGPISLTTFVTNSSMLKIVSPKGPILKGRILADQKMVSICVGVLKHYFLLVSKIFSEEWGNEDYSITSDKGIRGLLRLLIFILENKSKKDKKILVKRTLLELKNTGFDFGASNFKHKYAGEGGIKLLVDDEWLQLIGRTVPEFSSHSKKDLGDGIIPKEEDDYVEFKSSLRWSLVGGMVDKAVEKAVLKTINAFLNTDGGQLFVGVDDKGSVIGLVPDYSTFKNGKGTRDDFRLHLSHTVRSHMGDSFMDLVDIRFGSKEGRDFCIVKVEKSEVPVFMMDREFYYRSSASSVLLEGKELVRYTSRHWPS